MVIGKSRMETVSKEMNYIRYVGLDIQTNVYNFPTIIVCSIVLDSHVY